MMQPIKLRPHVLLVIFLLGLTVPAGAEALQLYLGHDARAGQVHVRIRGEHFTTYHYGQETRTPFLWPIHSEGEVGVTRNYPMGPDDPPSTDHPHHRSLHLTFGDVNGYDHWHRERIETRSIETGLAENHLWIRARNEWLTSAGDPLLREVQELRFYDTPASGRWFDIISTLTAVHEEVTFGDNKEGFFALRIRPEIQGNRAGILTNAEGRQGERNVYGRRSPWMDYSGPIEGHGTRGIALFDHPENFRYPTFWHVRDYGLAAANPFAAHSVGGEEKDGSHTLREGESMTFVYRVFVHTGDVDQAEVARVYREFAGAVFSR
jgi:hypothetical protein